MKAGKPLNRAALRQHPLPPVVDGDKETKGRILIIAGSREVPGAALLAATAAMRAGAGKLRIATVESIAAQVAVAMPEAMVVALPEHRDGGFARSAVALDRRELAADADAIVAGPGHAAGRYLPAESPTRCSSRRRALALDAALLRSLAPRRRAIAAARRCCCRTQASSRRCSIATSRRLQRDPIGCGLRAATALPLDRAGQRRDQPRRDPDGRAWTYRGGAPGLGVSGSGDVLAGIVGGLLARGAEPLTALLWGVWLHGEAGRRAGQEGRPDRLPRPRDRRRSAGSTAALDLLAA